MLMEDGSSSDEEYFYNDIQSLHVGTPLIHSTGLSIRLNTNIFLKMENIQPSGSVKMRGIGNFCSRKIQTRGTDIKFVCGSGVNTVLAVAYCARQLRVEAIIVVPTNTKESICDAIRLDGAQLIKFGVDWEAAETHARKLVKRNGIYVPSADHEHIWQGHSSIIHELKTQLLDNPPAAIICPVGSGGLLNGVILGLQEVGWKQVPVIAVETHGSNAFQAAVVAGKLVHLTKSSTLATSLEAKTVCAKTLELSLIHPVVPFAVSDAMAANSVRLFADDNKMLVEASSGAALSLCYTEIIRDILPNISPASDVIVLVTGGSDISLEHLDHYRKNFEQPPVVVKSGSDVFLKLDDALMTMDNIDLDHPSGISTKKLQEYKASREAELSSYSSQQQQLLTTTPPPSSSSPAIRKDNDAEDNDDDDDDDDDGYIFNTQEEINEDILMTQLSSHHIYDNDDDNDQGQRVHINKNNNEDNHNNREREVEEDDEDEEKDELEPDNVEDELDHVHNILSTSNGKENAPTGATTNDNSKVSSNHFNHSQSSSSSITRLV